VYALTQQGEAALDRWLGEPVARGRQFRMDFMAKLYFARREGPAVVRSLVERQRKACHAWVGHLTVGPGDQAEALFPRLVRSYRVGQIHAMLDWLNECEEVLSDAS
jgi:hypothetical protein